MGELWDLNLIRVFGVYLWVYLFFSTLRRFKLYRGIAALVLEVPNRWPRLIRIIKDNRVVFLTWATFRPAILTLIITVVYMIAARVVWPSASVTPEDLSRRWWLVAVVSGLGALMLGIDVYGVAQASRFERDEISEHLDQAEYWLKSWKAPVVRFFTLGYVDPRRMVREEVHKAMLAGRDLLNQTLWWVCMQMGVRIGFGLALWSVWALDNGF